MMELENMKRIVLKIVYKVLSVWHKVAMKNELAEQVEQCQTLMQKLRDNVVQQ